MKTPYLILFFIFLLTAALPAFSQEPGKKLIEEGIKLYDERKFEEAVAKYTEALKLNPQDYQAEYEIALTLYALNKKQEAIPHLENIVKDKEASKYEAYELLGSLYDDLNKPNEAIKMYLLGIKENPEYARLYFNLGVTYLRTENYVEAENCGEKAIKLDMQHPGSHWLYSMANYYQGKRTRAITTICSYLMLEPNTRRSLEAFKKLDGMLTQGISRKDEKTVDVTLPNGSLDSKDGPSKLLSVLTAASVVAKNLPPVEALEQHLKNIFIVQGESMAGIQKNEFYNKFFVEYFYKISQSDNLPAFAHYISLSAYNDDNVQWFKNNDDKLKSFSAWVRINERKF